MAHRCFPRYKSTNHEFASRAAARGAFGAGGASASSKGAATSAPCCSISVALTAAEDSARPSATRPQTAAMASACGSMARANEFCCTFKAYLRARCRPAGMLSGARKYFLKGFTVLNISFAPSPACPKPGHHEHSRFLTTDLRTISLFLKKNNKKQRSIQKNKHY